MPKRPTNSHAPSVSGARADRPAGLAAHALVGLLRLYRILVSPLLPAACRFEPTCSRFAIEAIERHGALRGVRLAVGRVARCHPWHAGGFDPVPPGRV